MNGTKSVIRCGKTTSLDDLLPTTIPFIISNAREQLEISIHPQNETGLTTHLRAYGKDLFKLVMEDVETFEKRTCRENSSSSFYNVMMVLGGNITDSNVTNEEFPLVSSFVSLFLPLGHIKSTTHRDDKFVEYFQSSGKWLRLHWHGC